MTDYNKGKPDGSAWIEPESDYRGEYPFNNITQTESGHFFEMDDTPGHERVRLQHRTGTFTEVQADGKRINKVFGDNFEIIVKDNNVLIKGKCNITIYGDSSLEVKGDVYQKIEGDVFQKVNGQANIEVEKNVTLSSGGEIDIIAGGGLLGGSVNLFAGDGVNVYGDLFVTGNINTNQSLNAAKNVNASQKMSATTGIDTIGGINCGFATPGPNSPGSITSTVSMNAPIGNFVLMTSILMTDVINTTIYSSHIHVCPDGLTSTPIIGMV